MPHVDGSLIGRREALRRAALTVGAAISAPTIAAVLAGCEARPADAHWRPRVLDDSQADLIGALVDQIIPQTDTPGARAAGVPQFIDALLADYYTAAERQRFTDGLREIDARAVQTYRQRFARCAPGDQRTLLEQLDREAFAPPAAASNEADSTRAAAASSPRATTPFFRTLKELTIVGYYTSRAGATTELHYVAVPGRYDGCVPLDKIGRTWAV